MFSWFKKDYKIFTVKFDIDGSPKHYAYRQYTVLVINKRLLLKEVRQRVRDEFPKAQNILVKHVINL